MVCRRPCVLSSPTTAAIAIRTTKPASAGRVFGPRIMGVIWFYRIEPLLRDAKSAKNSRRRCVCVCVCVCVWGPSAV